MPSVENIARKWSWPYARRMLCLVAGLFAFVFPHQAFAVESPTEVPLVVTIAAGYSVADLAGWQSLQEWERLYPFSPDGILQNVYRVRFTGTAQELVELRSEKFLKNVAIDTPVYADAIVTSDPYFTADATDVAKAWWLTKVRAPEAWELSKGSGQVTIALIDTGINGQHDDLNDGRVGNGYVSYCQVFSVDNNRCVVHSSGSIAASENSDDNGHGTIVAGIIGAIPDNGKGIAGLNWQVRLMPVKVLDRNGAGVSSDVAAGIVWAADHGANVINLSLGGTSIESSAVLTTAVTYAFDRGAVIVAAAGNDSALVGSDLDVSPVYPVCNDAGRNMIVGVAAVDMNDKKASFSNYGRACIDLTAPGTGFFRSAADQKGILSTYFDPTRPSHHNLYVYASGTSMAAPIVSGIAALLKSLYPDLTGSALRDRLINSTANVDAINTDNCRGINCTGRLGSGRIDALKALQTNAFLADSLIKDSSGRTYLVDNGVRRLVSPFVFAQRGFLADAIRTVPVAELEVLPLGTPLTPFDGTLVKSVNSPTIFSVSGGILLPTSYLVFRSHGFNFAHVVALPDDEVAGYRIGPNLLAGNGAVMKIEGQPAVFFVHEGKRRLISYASFVNRGLKFDHVVEVDAAEFSRYPEDRLVPLQPPLDGALIKSADAPTIYVVQDGVLQALSAEAFQSRGYNFAQVLIVPQSELGGYSIGIPVV